MQDANNKSKMKRFIKGVGPVRTDFGLKFQVHLTKDFDHFLNTKVSTLFGFCNIFYSSVNDESFVDTTRVWRKGVGPIRTDFGLKFQVHLKKDFDTFLNT